MARRINLTGFILKAIVFLVILAVAWYFIAPAYNRILTAVSSALIPGRAALDAKNSIYIYTPAGELVGGIYILALHYGLVLVIVLVAATPGMRLVRRLRALGIAVVGIFCLNVASIVLFARAALAGLAGSEVQNPVVVLFTVVGSDLFPVVIWAWLSYKYFLLPQPKNHLKDSHGLKLGEKKAEPASSS